MIFFDDLDPLLDLSAQLLSPAADTSLHQIRYWLRSRYFLLPLQQGGHLKLIFSRPHQPVRTAIVLGDQVLDLQVFDLTPKPLLYRIASNLGPPQDFATRNEFLLVLDTLLSPLLSTQPRPSNLILSSRGDLVRSSRENRILQEVLQDDPTLPPAPPLEF